MKAWVLREYGDPMKVLELAEIDQPSPAPDQLLVQVEASGLAFPDLLRVQGLYQVTQPLGTAPGAEFVGRVVSGGESTTIAPGTRIMGVADIGDGTLAEYVVVRELAVGPVPDGMPTAVAATVSSNYVVAYIALHVRARVQPGDVVVVNGGAGGVGSAAIQLAKAAGNLLGNAYGAPGVDASTTDLVAAIQEFSDGHGADVVIDTVGGDVFHACRRAIAFEGRIVIIGFTSGHIPELKVNALLLRNFTIMGMNIFFYEFTPYLEEIVKLWSQGKVNPPVEAEYPFDEAAMVLQRIAERKVKGRAVVRVP